MYAWLNENVPWSCCQILRFDTRQKMIHKGCQTLRNSIPVSPLLNHRSLLSLPLFPSLLFFPPAIAGKFSDPQRVLPLFIETLLQYIPIFHVGYLLWSPRPQLGWNHDQTMGMLWGFFTGNTYVSWEKTLFTVDVPLNQSIDTRFWPLHNLPRCRIQQQLCWDVGPDVVNTFSKSLPPFRAAKFAMLCHV
jgi:hypothetical protein